jgi:hypothetical protein
MSRKIIIDCKIDLLKSLIEISNVLEKDSYDAKARLTQLIEDLENG